MFTSVSVVNLYLGLHLEVCYIWTSMFTLESVVMLNLDTNLCLYRKCCVAAFRYKSLHLKVL